MSLYFRLFWTGLRAHLMGYALELHAFEFLKHGTTMARGNSKGAIVESAGFVSSADARDEMGLVPAWSEFPASICPWIETERLMSV